ncbi:O-antigen ligase [Geodermatophilus sp. DSM 44513]|uniref:O-antigen ligase family protein n=1 Tax=Geodermatophilus sp. DSM 44513 TaxID=1528104 RepID=UPI00126D0068|nr:O-antigen ligase family protein [Geodermatophilus sp. DSM 44513]WNV76010.1 O-antigen ligase family protein [Geodermatophilus sp. DSM 44513]
MLMLYVGLLFILPARLVLPGMGGAGRPTVALGLGLLLWWLLTRLHPHLATPGWQPVRLVLCLLTITILISYAAGLDRGLLPLEARSADRYLLIFGAWLGVALTAADGLRSRVHVDRLLTALICAGTFTALLGALQFYNIDLTPYLRFPGLVYNQDLVGVGVRGGPDFNRVYGTQQHYIEFGVVLAMLLPIAIYRAFTAITRTNATLRWTQVAIIAASVPFSISRAGVLGVAVGSLVLSAAWDWRRRLKAALIAGLALVAFRAAVPGVLGTLKSAFLNVEADPSIQGRRADYAATWSYIVDRPWFGRGVGTYVPEIYRLLDNQYLGALLETGIAGTLAMSVAFLSAYWLGRTLRRRGGDRDDTHLGQALAATASVAIVTSFTFDSLAFPTFAGVFFLCLGVAGAMWRLVRDRTPSDPHRQLDQALSASAPLR